MARITLRQLLDHAAEHDYGVPAFNINNMEQALAIMDAASSLDAIPPEGMILDVGPQSIVRINAAIDDAATLVWNGPLGAFEMTPFDRGTMVSAKHAAERTKAKKLISVAGGGDTVAALNQAHVAGDFSYVSTAGGAFLEWMEGKPLPGVEVLRAK